MNFLDSLAEARRRAILSGKPLSNAEIQGMQQGYFTGQEQMSNAKRAEMVREQQAKDNLQFQRESEQAQMDAARKAGINQTVGNLTNTGVSLLGADYMNKPAGESAISKGWTGVKNYFADKPATFTEATNAAPATPTLIAPDAVEGAGVGVGAEAPVGAGVGATEAAGTGAETATAAGGPSIGGVGALIAGGMLTKKLMAPYAEGGEKERGGVVGYLANASQTPVNSVLTPGQAFVDAGWIKPNSAVGQVVGLPGKIERAVMDPLGKVGGCIIVTACTSKDSPEVNLTREFRDKFMTPEQLRGYYMIAESIVPIINRSSIIKYLVKKVLVDNLIEYGAYILGKSNKFPSLTSRIITDWFMNKCRKTGLKVKQFTRQNGEVF